MADKNKYKNLGLRLRNKFPASINYVLVCHDEQTYLININEDESEKIMLEEAITFSKKEEHSFLYSTKDLPKNIQSLYSNTQSIIVSKLSNDSEAIYLLTGIRHSKNENSELVLCVIDLIIENYSLKEINDAKEKKYQDYLREVKTIKEKLLPHEDYVIEGLDYATYYRPSVGGGGDFFDLVDLRAARRRAGYANPPLIWGMGVIDVSGHGPGAAVEVAMLDAIMRTYQAEMGAGPAEAMAYINRHYFTRRSRGGYCTGFLCNYDADSDVFSYTSAGHLPVLIKHREGHVSTLESQSGIPIGIDREYQWTTETTQLEQGDTIIMFTDGISEAESLAGEQYGMERLITCLEQSPASSAEILMSNFMDNFHQHISNAVDQDDQTLIMVTISK